MTDVPVTARNGTPDSARSTLRMLHTPGSANGCFHPSTALRCVSGSDRFLPQILSTRGLATRSTERPSELASGLTALCAVFSFRASAMLQLPKI